MPDPSVSIPSPDRRLFLRAVCGGGLILGLGGLARFGLADEKDRRAPQSPEAFWVEAKKQMKALGRQGVAIVVPADAEAREALGKQLQALVPLMSLHESAPPAARPLLSNVWVCVEGSQVGALPGETLVLLDCEGKRVAGARLDLGGERDTLLAGIKVLTEGEGRLAAQVQRVRSDPALARILDDLSSGKGEREQRGGSALEGKVAALAPALFALLDGKGLSDQAGHYVRAALARAYFQRIQAAGGLPYGAQFKVEVNMPEPCPPCGMAAPSVSGRTFLDFFTRER